MAPCILDKCDASKRQNFIMKMGYFPEYIYNVLNILLDTD